MSQTDQVVREPLAIVGIGCRLPGGVSDPESFWQLLSKGGSGIVEIPPDRWDKERYFHADVSIPRKMNSQWGGFVEDVDQFDAKFWGITPREAIRMDPQQRWMLECAWEAIEDAGYDPGQLAGTRTGVYVGVASHDYADLQASREEDVDVHTNLGSTLSIVSNRVSYALDLRGPSIAIDTACSSSLVAVDLGCKAIWSGEIGRALVGGVNVLLAPDSSIGFSKASMLSPDGQCHTFDASANGYVRSEGAGMVMLVPLSSALAHRDRIYATIRASVVNQDGKTSSITVPGAAAQEQMLRQAYREAGIEPGRVTYMEAHGTGTPVGDPIETNALGAVLTEGRPASDHCLIGSVKTNIGHLETASGVAGLIKAALVLRHRMVPPSLNFHAPNPHIDLDGLRLRVVTEMTPLQAWHGGLPIASVNSFGFGGTNAHVVLEAAPPAQDSGGAAATADRPLLLPVSAKDEAAVRAYANKYRRFLRGRAADLAEICASAGLRKAHHEHRVVIRGDNREVLRERLRRLAAGESGLPGVLAGVCSDPPTPLVFVFSGQGGQWWHMGGELLRREPVFRNCISAIDAQLRRFAGWSLLDEMGRDEAHSNIGRTSVAQPAIFALQVALAELWRSWGIRPAKVIGHSVGEVAAAYVAGAYRLADAVKIIVQRSRLQERTHDPANPGRMYAAALSESEARRLLTGREDRVVIGAINSPSMLTLSGDQAVLAEIAAELTTQGKFVRELRIQHAFHTHHMDPIREALLDGLESIQPIATRIPFISTVTGQIEPGESLDAAYWWRNVREPVRFAPAIERLLAGGDHSFLELGPHPALQTAIAECMQRQNRKGGVYYSLKRGMDESDEILANLAALHNAGQAVDWREVNQASGAFVAQPAYPWRRERYWLEAEENRYRHQAPTVHPLLRIRVPAPRPTFESYLDPRLFTYLNDHRIWDSIVFPAAGYAEMGLALCDAWFPEQGYCLEDLEIKQALFVSEAQVPTVRVVIDEAERAFFVYSNNGRNTLQDWALNAQGRLRKLGFREPAVVDLARLRDRMPRHIDRESYYQASLAAGYQFGADFQHLRNVWCGKLESLVEIQASEGIASALDDYCFHPALLDACLQGFKAAQAFQDDAEPDDSLYLPVRMGRVRIICKPVPAELWAHIQVSECKRESLICDIGVYDQAGVSVAEILDFRADRAPRKDGKTEELENSFYQFRYQPRHLRGARASQAIRLTPISLVAETLKSALPEIGEACDLAGYLDTVHPKLEAAAIQAICHALARLGGLPSLGERLQLSQLAERYGVSAAHQPLLRAWLSVLADEGVLCPVDAQAWEVREPLRAEPLDGTLDALVEDYQAWSAEADLLRWTAPSLADVLSGDLNPADLLFPDGQPVDVLSRVHGEALHPYHDLIRQAVARLVDGLPPRRVLRILEVGAGSGALTRAVLPVLPSHRCEYTFTDVSPALLSAARRQFSDHSCIEFKPFDIEVDPRSQHIEPHGYDLILASHALHATADLETSLANLKQCLAEKGALILLEPTRDRALQLVTHALLPDWWRYRDGQWRDRFPLPRPADWQALLRKMGFQEVQDISESSLRLQTVFIAGAPPAVAQAADVESAQAGTGKGATSRTPLGTAVILGGRSAITAGIGANLRTAGFSPVRVTLGEGYRRLSDDQFEIDSIQDADWRRLFDALEEAGHRISQIVHCWTLDQTPADTLSVPELVSSQTAGVHGLRCLIRSLADRSDVAPRLMVVTRGRVSVAGEAVPGLAAAPITGFCRVANNEQSQCAIAMLDLDPNPAVDEVMDICAEILKPDGETEVAYRGDIRFVPRLQAVSLDQFERLTRPVADDDGPVTYRLEIEQPGALRDLMLAETPRRPPGQGEVEIQVKAAGINFRDLMKALGMYPGDSIDRTWLGDDVSGTVVRVGPEVSQLRSGDDVLGLVPYGFRGFVTVDQRFVLRKPEHLSFAAAATLPTVFATSYYALVHLARMAPGERLLIHAGTGGVGSAAIQIAKQLGLEIFATAGTPEKRQLLREWGVRYVMDSRSLDFADQVRKITQGEGVDCVLNSLAGDFIPKSLACLRRFGRFVEIGKVDVHGNAKLGLELLKNNISFFVVDLPQLLESRPAFTAEMLDQLRQRFQSRAYAPLPYRRFPITDAVEAFRYMAQGRHIGKNVLDFEIADIKVARCTQAGHLFRPNGSYLITGGAGGFGLALAKWMAKNGARNLVLVSRSGAGPKARVDIESLRSAGIKVIDARVDVTDQTAVGALIDQLQASDARLAGIIHGAMVLDDKAIVDLDEADFNRALYPKMLGAWILHALTQDIPLELFVCFSSFSALIGTPRQANYNAGNAFLEALAQHRHALGLPSLTMSWGALRGAGFVERHDKTAQYLEKVGMGAYDLDEAFSVLRRFIGRQAVGVGAARVDWGRLAGLLPGIADAKRFSSVVLSHADGKGNAARSRILSAAPNARRKLMVDFLAREVATVVDAGEAEIDPRAPLNQLGLDSLMAVELVNRIESQLGFSVPLSAVFSGPNLGELASQLLDRLLDAADEDDIGGGPDRGLVASPADQPDLQAEAILDDDIRPAEPAGSMNPEPKAVLLTGGTGFLGAYLIHELLLKTHADIYCLVRAASPESGQRRLRENLERYGLWDRRRSARIIPILGDIGVRRFGMPRADYEHLADLVEVIYHSAAMLNFVMPYESFKATNVDGTKEVLRFACQRKPKAVHHISTVAVFESSIYGGQTVAEDDAVSATEDMLLGYSQSKWVAEKLALMAAERGVPVTIYRPSLILGDSRTGTVDTDSFFCWVTKCCLELGACFDLDTMLDASPVDYVSRAIVYLSRQPASPGKAFHLQHPKPVLLREWLRDGMAVLHADLEQLSYREWIDRLGGYAGNLDDQASSRSTLSRLLPVFKETASEGLTFLELNTIGRRPNISSKATQVALRDAGITCPELSEAEYLAKGAAYLVASGFLELKPH